MAIANLAWDVDETTLAALIAAGFESWVIERQIVAPNWDAISHKTTRPPLVGTVLRYLYTDGTAPVAVATGLPSATYRARPRKADGTFGTAVAVSAKRRGYIAAQDVWDEGYVNPPWTAAKVWRGIDRATATIDALCRQWFEPRYAQIVLDGTDRDQLWLDLPVCALFRLLQDDVTIDLTDITVYNRHLTRGQLNPDDRQNPKLSYSYDFPVGYRGRRSRLFADAALFGYGRQNVVAQGVFGYTELGPGDMAAETEERSQVPISYGVTPSEITRACLLLALTYMMPATDQQEAALQGRITGVKTRDQSITFADMSSYGGGGDASFGLTGNLEVDKILMRYSGPLRMGAAG